MASIPESYEDRPPAVAKTKAGNGRRAKLLRNLLMVAALMTAVAATAVKVTSLPAFCGSCHEMRPEYVTWQASAHNKVACVTCHVAPGLAPALKHKLASWKQVYDHVTKKYYLPIQMGGSIPNETCEQCHTTVRHVTPSGDIKIPHDKHLAKGLTCIKCHPGVAHGTIAERQVTIDGDFARWTATVGRENMARGFLVLKMDQCVSCHKDNKGPLTCESCHQEIVRPPTHGQVSWVNAGEHGRAAYQDVQACNKCHSNTLSFKTQRSSDQVASYARNNTYCVQCHRIKPPGHGAGWNVQHGVQARQDQRGCLVCHEQATAKKSDQIAATVCMECHRPHHGFPGPSHPIPLTRGTQPDGRCWQCHPQDTCAACHRQF